MKLLIFVITQQFYNFKLVNICYLLVIQSENKRHGSEEKYVEFTGCSLQMLSVGARSVVTDISGLYQACRTMDLDLNTSSSYENGI
jgi:hypothetical protein